MSRQSVIKNKKIEKRKNVSKKIVTIIDVKNYVGQEVTIGAWVANKSGKGKIAFLQLRDGSAFFQGVAFKPNFIEKFGEEVGLEKFDTIKRLSQETSVYVTGIVKEFIGSVDDGIADLHHCHLLTRTQPQVTVVHEEIRSMFFWRDWIVI